MNHGFGFQLIKVYLFIIGVNIIVVKNKIIISAVFILLLSCFSQPIKKESNNNFLNLQITQNFDDASNTNIDLIIKFPVKNLVFNKMIQSFYSEITFDVLVNDKEEKIIFSESWNEIIKKTYYEETKTGELIITKSINLPIGEYSLNLIINDFDNDINWNKSSKFDVRKVKGLNNVQIYYKVDNSFIQYDSNYSIEDIDTFWVDYSINDLDKTELICEYEFLDIVLKDNINSEVQDDKINIIVFEDEKSLNDYTDFKDVIFKKRLHFKDSNSKIPVPVISDYFNVLKIRLKYKNQVIVRTLNFIDNREFEYDYSVLFGPMFYLLNSKYYYFEELSYDEKISYIKTYWKNIQNKNNDSGKLLKEFYKRTQYVNKQYSFLTKQGWESDRGRIYIIHGPPNKINNEFNDIGEFEVWIYHANKRYVFIKNFGQYELYNTYD